MPFDEDSNWMTFELGTSYVMFGETEFICDIFGISNKDKGNGDFDKTVKWFENKCKIEGKTLIFSCIENERLKIHLNEKRGYTVLGSSTAQKIFKNEKNKNI